MEAQAEQVKIMLIGTEGTGKSTLGNALINDGLRQAFPEVADKIGGKFTLKSQTVKLVNNKEAFLAEISDNANSGNPQLDAVAAEFKSLRYVNSFILVLNSQEPRFDKKFQSLVDSFYELAGEKIFQHLCVVFTRWSQDERAIRNRRNQDTSEVSKTEELNEYLGKKYRIPFKIPCYFVDCFDSEDIESLHTQKTKEALLNIFNFCISKESLDCSDFKAPAKTKLILFTSPEAEAYETRMKDRKNLIGPIECYFDCRDIHKSQSLINDIYETLEEISRTDNRWYLSAGNFEHVLREQIRSRLSPRVVQSLSSILKKEDLDIEGDYFRTKVSEKKHILLEGLIALVVGGVVELILIILGTISYFVLPTMFIIPALLITYRTLSWKRKDVITKILSELTQEIAYNRGLKKHIIETADKMLESKGQGNFQSKKY